MFQLMDKIRQAQGDALGLLGLGPSECEYRVLASGPYWRLRDYPSADARVSVLMVPAPIKRPYIWDLAPTVSAVRYCLDRHLRVYLVEWLPPSHLSGNGGVDDYVDGISQCVVARWQLFSPHWHRKALRVLSCWEHRSAFSPR